MPQGTIDEHPDRGRIEFDLARGVPVRVVMKKYGVSKDAAYRFRRKLPPQLRAAALGQRLKAGADLEKLRIEESESILKNLGLQRARLLLLQDHALDCDDRSSALSAAGHLHKNIELVGKYLGEFATHQVKTEISILVQPGYLRMRARMMRALAPFPEARRAVAAALHEIETDTSEAGAPMLEAPQPAAA